MYEGPEFIDLIFNSGNGLTPVDARWFQGNCHADVLDVPPASNENVCPGTLLSRAQYLHDIEQLGYVDGRLTPASAMTAHDVQAWTEAIPSEKAQERRP